jgi:hypothetical protein
MSDPTYVKSEIDANPTWKLAFELSEIDNDNAPIGWFKYIHLANHVIKREKAAVEAALRNERAFPHSNSDMGS